MCRRVAFVISAYALRTALDLTWWHVGANPSFTCSPIVCGRLQLSLGFGQIDMAGAPMIAVRRLSQEVTPCVAGSLRLGVRPVVFTGTRLVGSGVARPAPLRC